MWERVVLHKLGAGRPCERVHLYSTRAPGHEMLDFLRLEVIKYIFQWLQHFQEYVAHTVTHSLPCDTHVASLQFHPCNIHTITDLYMITKIHSAELGVGRGFSHY